MDPDITPKIYVASLSDYNAGRLHGVWIDATEGMEAISIEIEAMLAASPEPGAEEYAIHDYEGFGPVRLLEYESLADVAAIAAGIQQHGHAFAVWADHLRSTADRWHSDLDQFEECFIGRWDSLADYGDHLLDLLGIDLDDDLPSLVAPYIYFDREMFALDFLDLHHIVLASDGVYIFED